MKSFSSKIIVAIGVATVMFDLIVTSNLLKIHTSKIQTIEAETDFEYILLKNKDIECVIWYNKDERFIKITYKQKVDYFYSINLWNKISAALTAIRTFASVFMMGDKINTYYTSAKSAYKSL